MQHAVKLYQLPAALEKYIQDKAASGLGALFLLPWCFPVFVMNPFQYADNFKATLISEKTAGSGTTLDSDSPATDEIWEIRHLFLECGVSQTYIYAQIMFGGASVGTIYDGDNVRIAVLNPNIVLTSGYSIRMTSSASVAKVLGVYGVKRYA